MMIIDTLKFVVFLLISLPGDKYPRIVKSKYHNLISTNELAIGYLKATYNELEELALKCINGELDPQVLYNWCREKTTESLAQWMNPAAEFSLDF